MAVRWVETSTVIPPLRPVSCTPHTKAAPADCSCKAVAVCCSVPPAQVRPCQASADLGPSLCDTRVKCVIVLEGDTNMDRHDGSIIAGAYYRSKVGSG